MTCFNPCSSFAKTDSRLFSYNYLLTKSCISFLSISRANNKTTCTQAFFNVPYMQAVIPVSCFPNSIYHNLSTTRVKNNHPVFFSAYRSAMSNAKFLNFWVLFFFFFFSYSLYSLFLMSYFCVVFVSVFWVCFRRQRAWIFIFRMYLFGKCVCANNSSCDE